MHYKLAIDAFESVKLLPSSPLLWQRLSSLISQLEGEEQVALINKIKLLSCSTRDAKWLQYSALACLTRDSHWMIEQAALANSNTSPDAICTLLGLAWHHALVRTSERDAFVKIMRDINAQKLLRMVAKQLPCSIVPQRDAEHPFRLAIYTPQVLNSCHGGTFFTLNVMSVLALQGINQHGFAAQETTINEGNSYCGGEDFLTPLSVDTNSLVLNVPGNVQITLPDTEFSLRFRFEQMLSAIHSYMPDVVIFVGFMSPLIYRLYEHFPVVGLSVHALPPIAPVDVWLCADPQVNEKQWPDLPIPQVVHFPFRFWPKGQAVPIDRSSLHIPASALVLITIGYRLDIEMSQPWSDFMISFIESHPEVHWLLVGIPEGRSLNNIRQHSRIHTMIPQSLVETWLAASDIYVNPPRIGGGGSVSIAMEQGVPVLTFVDCDAGDKVGTCAVTSMDQYFNQLSLWVTDETLRRRVGVSLKERFYSNLDLSSKTAQERLMHACQLAVESFNHRMGHN